MAQLLVVWRHHVHPVIAVKVYFGQVYIEPNVTFPFSHQFQRRLSEEVTALVNPSATFTQRYGDDWHLMFNVSAKRAICDNEIRGPSVFRKTKDVEFTIFLPFDTIQRGESVSQSALAFLLQGVYSVLASIGIDASPIQARQARLTESICSDSTMFTPNDRRA